MSNYSNASLLTQDERVADEQLVEEAQVLTASRSAARSNRRSFITNLSVAAAAAGTLGFAGCSDNSAPIATTPISSTPSVVDVLNFALNLEYLEASFYSYLYTGNGLASADLGGTPTITGGAKYTSTNPVVAQLMQNLYQDEQAHVQLLRATIQSAFGVAPVVCPSLNLAALGAVTSDATFLASARQLETVGVSAYAGGAQYLTLSTAALTYAAQILHVEAQHEGLLRQLCIQLGVTSGPVDTLDMPPTATAIVNTSPTTGLNPVRTTSQVLQIVYGQVGNTGVASGGFFPAGLNGNIKVS